MGNSTDTTDRQTGLQRPVRVAYTLNNQQPVRCSYVSDEPLFYLDGLEDPGDGEMDLSADEIMDHLAEIEAGEDPLNVFQRQFASGTTEKVTIENLTGRLGQSRMGKVMLEFAISHGVTIEYASRLTPAFYDRAAGKIFLREDLSQDEQILLLARELRRVWQHRQGVLLHPLLFHPDHAIIINRVQAADLQTLMVRVAWELRLAGDHGPWDRLEQGGHADLTNAMQREALTDFRTLSGGRAATAVFEAWFLSERCRRHDRLLIQQMLADYQGYVFKAGHAETSAVLTRQLIAALGAMPMGKNYLSPHAGIILSDPVFTDIRDRSSANFLWFIKFEQSFRQAEQELQKGGETSSTDPSAQDLSSNAQTASAQILSWPLAGSSPPRRQPGTLHILSGSADVVDLRDWRTTRVNI